MYSKLSTHVIISMTLFLSLIFLPRVNAQSPVPVMLAKKTLAGTTEFNALFLKEKLTKKLGLNIVKVESTPLKDMAVLFTEQGIFYASYDGNFLIQGKLYSIEGSVTDLTEQSLAGMRLDGIKKFANDVIEYPAKDEKYVVTVFTDITCGYCRKMHAEMDEYNERGITFRYLAYPRSGIKDRLGNYTDGYKDLRSVWCSEDSAAALTSAKSGSGIAYRICDKPIEGQFDFGRQIGVTGTPAIILPNGMMVPGYQPPAQLEELLKKV